MIFTPVDLAGAYLVESEPQLDSRGFFARTFCAREFIQRRLAGQFVQCSVSLNRRKGTLRGLHYQRGPAAEAKLVRCSAGSIYDVIVDLRPESPTFLRHVGVELRADERRALYVPELCAHGFQTLEDDTEVFYQISNFHDPKLSDGVRFDDPKLGLRWPLPVSAISDKDRGLPLLDAR